MLVLAGAIDRTYVEFLYVLDSARHIIKVIYIRLA